MPFTSGVVSLNQNYPTTGYMLVPGPNPQDYTVYLYFLSDWAIGNRAISLALGSSAVDGSGNWITPILAGTPGVYTVVIAKTGVMTELIPELTIGEQDDTVVFTVNGIQGDVTLYAGANVTITPNSPATGDITISATGGGGGGGAFNDVTSGTNTGQTLTVGNSSTLGYSGTGVVDANEVGGINVTGNVPTHAGQLLISQPGNTTAVWADPQVQGLYAAGSSISSPPSYTAPTTICPILIGASDSSGNLQNLHVDGSGNLAVVFSGSLPAGSNLIGQIEVTDGTNILGTSSHPVRIDPTGTTTQPVSGTVAVSALPNVTVSTLPSIPTGSNLIGQVEVTDGTNVLFTSGHPAYVQGSVGVSSLPAIPAGTNLIGQVEVVDGAGHVQPAGDNVARPIITELTDGTNILGTSSHPLNVSNAASGTTGAAVPSYANYIGFNSSGNLVGASSSNPFPVTVISGGGGGTQYTDGAGVVTPTGTVAMGWDGTDAWSLRLDSNKNLKVIVENAAVTVGYADTISTGNNITAAGQNATASLNGDNLIIFNVTGSWVGTLTPQYQLPDGSWVAGSVFPILSAGAVVSSITANGQWKANVAGMQGFRIHATAWTSGTAGVNFDVSTRVGTLEIHQLVASNLNATTVSEGATGSAVPADAAYLGFNASGNLVGVSSSNPLPVTISGGGGSSIGAITFSCPSTMGTLLSTPVSLNPSSQGDNIVIPGVSGQTVRIYQMILIPGAMANLKFGDSGSNYFTGPMPVTKYGTFALGLNGNPYFITASGKGFVINSDAVGCPINGIIYYIQS